MVKLIYSNPFQNLLTRIYEVSDNSVMYLLLQIGKMDLIDFGMDYIDITDHEDIIRFRDVNKLLKRFNRLHSKLYDGDFAQYQKETLRRGDYKGRRGLTDVDYEIGFGEIKIGRFIKKLIDSNIPLCNSFKAARCNSKTIDKDVENFVNIFKSCLNKEHFVFEIVSGNDIKKYYHKSSYKVEQGILGNSCMAKPSCQSYLDIYVKNPDVCKLLILKYKSDLTKIIGRALLWTLSDGRTFMDRVYITADSDLYTFYEKAKQIGAIQSINNHGGSMLEHISVNIKHKHKPKTFLSFITGQSEYPFMDTLRYFNLETNEISNKTGIDEKLDPKLDVTVKQCGLTHLYHPTEWLELCSTKGEYYKVMKRNQNKK
jgi:hypothetical protein